ncbi:MAG: glycosyl hydrolase [Holophagales bacterium]|nr:glycosyl hydrolase [Holophagales bacterium]
MRNRALLSVLLLSSPSLPSLLAAPPATKTEEALRLHPSARGMSAATRLAGYERRLAMEKASPFANLAFRNVGPEVQGGRIVDIDGPLSRPDTLFVAFASGGLWRTDNKGGSWTPLFDRESSMTLGAIAVGDADGNVLWAGTGEANSSRTSYAGTGVFKSVDGGKTWASTGLRDSHHVGKILVDARTPDTVFVAALGPLYTDGGERGLYRTTDGGKSWTKVLGGPGRTGAIDVVADPKEPGVLYAALWERDRKPWNFLESGPGSGIYRSKDGGSTWVRLAGGFPQGDVVGRIGLAVTAARLGTVYAVVDNQARRPGERDEETPPGELTPRRLKALAPEQFAKVETAVVERFLRANDFPKELEARALQKDVASGKVKLADVVAYVDDADRQMVEVETVGKEVYRSDDSGDTWKKTHDVSLEKVAYSYGYYFGKIWVSPEDASKVYLAGVPLAGSDDGGKTWRGLDRLGVHGDHHALRFAPGDARHVALGNDGGLNLSWDGGQTWTKVNNLPVGQITTIAVDSAEPYNVVCGLQDNGVMRGPSTYVPGKSSRESWKAIFGGDGSWIEIDPKDPNVVYTASQFGHASRLNLKTGQRERIRPRQALGEPALRYNWVTPFLLSPHSRNILWFGTQKLWRSFDRGETWTAVSSDLTSPREPGDVPFGTITTISESPKTFGVLYAGTDEGKIWGTRDGGATWKDLSKGLAKERWVTRVVASAHDDGTVFVSQSGLRNDDFAPYVWKSADFGATWTSIAAGLPDEPVNSVREDPKARHLLWAATDAGAFVSLDRGATWSALTGGLPHVPVHDLAIHPKEGDVVLGTHGRSAFVAEAAPLRELTPEVAKKALHAFEVKAATWERRRGYGENEFFSWYRVPTTRTLAWWAGAPAAGTATITVKDVKGRVWKEWTTPSVEGFNAFAYDLSADPALADANEEAMRKEAAEARGKAVSLSGTAPRTEADEDADEAGSKATPPEVARLLADPLRTKRERTLPPGRYTIGIAAGKEMATTRIEVKAPKKEDAPEED